MDASKYFMCSFMCLLVKERRITNKRQKKKKAIQMMIQQYRRGKANALHGDFKERLKKKAGE